MDLLAIIGSLIAGTVAAVVAFACFFLIHREFRRRRQPHLLVFSLAFLACGLGFSALFVSRWAWAYAALSASVFGYGLASFFLTVVPFLVLEGVSRIRGGRFVAWRSLANAVAALAFLLILAVWDRGSLSAFFPGISGGAGGWPLHTLTVIAWVLGLAGLAAGFLARNLGFGTRRLGGLSLASLSFGIFLGALVLSGRNIGLVPAVYASVSVFMILLSLAVSAFGHPDREVTDRPWRMVQRSLTFKAVIFNVVSFWVMSFLVMAIAVLYFVRLDVHGKQLAVTDGTVRMSKCVTNAKDSALQAVQFLSFSSRRSPIVASGDGWRSDGTEYLLDANRSQFIRILDGGGRVIYGNFGSDEIGRDFIGLRAVQGALAGRSLSFLEEDPGFGRVMLQAAAPVSLEGGKQGVILLSRQMDLCQDTVFGTGLMPTGFGMVDRFGRPIVSAGHPIDLRQATAEYVTADDVLSLIREGHGGLAAVEAIGDADGRIEAFVFSHLSPTVIHAGAVRLAAVIILILLAALAMITVVLTYSLTGLVRPIREMRKVARAVESGDYGRRVSHGGQDELGQLAVGFNRMAVTIGEQTERLRRQMREQEDFLINTAHEMRTPINIFSWTVDLMRFGDTGRMNKSQLDLVHQLRQTTDRLSALVQNLLDTAEMDRGGISVQAEDVNLSDIIDAAAALITVRVKEKRLEMLWERPEPAMMAVGDGKRIRQVLDNLLGNSVKYSHKGGRIRISLAPASRRSPDGPKGKYLKVTVEDNGRGIPKDEQHRVFTRFFRSRNAVAGDIEGAGLGLHIVRRLVELQGGEVWFESVENVGSVFSFTVPAASTRKSQH
ncbi:HAMP domain-containing histidine kinase [Candidatus Uhrbacteria bacterium]|nr:HAMP domain-containing histidine kinase [Candidatus Uhrbacteria bacterium]